MIQDLQSTSHGFAEAQFCYSQVQEAVGREAGQSTASDLDIRSFAMLYSSTDQGDGVRRTGLYRDIERLRVAGKEANQHSTSVVCSKNTHLMTPLVWPTSGVTAIPSLTIFSTEYVASKDATARNTVASATCMPGHDLQSTCSVVAATVNI